MGEMEQWRATMRCLAPTASGGDEKRALGRSGIQEMRNEAIGAELKQGMDHSERMCDFSIGG